MKRIEVEVSVEQVRAWFYGESLDEVENALDQALGDVQSTEESKVLVIISVVP